MDKQRPLNSRVGLLNWHANEIPKIVKIGIDGASNDGTVKILSSDPEVTQAQQSPSTKRRLNDRRLILA